MEETYPLEPLDLMKCLLKNYPRILDSDHSVWPSFSVEDTCSFVYSSGNNSVGTSYLGVQLLYYIGVIPRNRCIIVPSYLCHIPPLELLFAQHIEPSLAFTLLSLQFYCRKLPDGFDIRNFCMIIPSGWEYQVFNI